MKKQTLFATGSLMGADGRAKTDVAILTPDDKTALELVSKLSYVYSRKCTYHMHDAYEVCFKVPGFDWEKRKKVFTLCKNVMREFQGFYHDDRGTENEILFYTDSTYQFLAKDTVEHLQVLFAKISGMPQKVDDDEFEATDGRIVTVEPKNYTVRIDYRIPFDRAAWEKRHKNKAEVDTIDAAAASATAEAARKAAEASQAEQRAKLLKAARIGVTAAVVLLIVFLVVVIAKKK